MASIKLLRRHVRIVHLYVTLVATAILVLTGGSTGRHERVEAQARTGCAADANPVRCENMLPGDVDWDISGSGSASIQGFATDMSVDYGGTVDFKIATDATAYTIDIYRMGYYNGAGARKVATIAPSATLPQTQPACQSDAALGLVDCGNWATSASWTIPDDAVSGIYFAVLLRTDGTPGVSHVFFVVRDDTRAADVLFQTSDTTWQAYNTYGGASTYCAPSGVGYSNAGTAYGCLNRAVKVSYNRPFDTRDHDSQSFLFNAEYPMVRFLEANGFDVKYWAGVDTDRRGADLVGALKPKVFVSTGHDEYWSGPQRTYVENARNAGVNLAFFSGNEVYWKHRFEPSIVDGTSHRTMVVYKETLAGTKIDPAVDPVTNTPIWTGTWRDTRFSPPGDGGRPENALLGQIWTVNCCTGTITVPASMRDLRIWENTRIAELTSGAASLGSETLGYEWGEALENGYQPAGLIRMSSTTMEAPEKILDFGSIVGPGTATHSLTLYKHNSGALVFAAGTVQWAWGLDSQHDRGGPAAHVPDQAMQQATITLFADMGAQPSTLQVGADPARPLVTMAASNDIFAPTSNITSPAAGAPVESGDRVVITGTAADTDGSVGGVEVSVDGGVTWRKANGTTAWTFEWSPGALGDTTIRSRAVDDSGNLEIPSAGVTVSVQTGTCPCESLFKPSTAPENPSFPDNSAYELGIKFYSDIGGYITGIRFYKGVNNTGTHIGSLWNLAGERLATATFTNETASGWQEVLFDEPVPIISNTTYVASYHTNVGHYAVTANYFASVGIDSPPLHAPPSGDVGGNGVFAQGAHAYPNLTFNAGNYWVDVVFSTTNTDTTPPEITNVVQTTIDSSKVEVTWDTDELSTSKIEYSTISTFPANATSTVTSTAFVTSHRLTLAGLAPNTTYYYRVSATDGPGNVATVFPPTFTLPGPTLRDTAESDFAAGTGVGTYVSAWKNGELILAPAVGTEFSGTAMPDGWIATPWGSGGFASVGNGILRVDGSRVGTCSGDPCSEQGIYSPGRSLEFEATFTGDAFQHAGLAVTLGSATEPWAIFSTLQGGNLYARTNTGTQSQDILLGGTLLGAMHRYRIDWKSDGTVDYYVDGALVASSPLAVTGLMRPVAASDFSVFGGNILVNWLHLTPYGGSGTFLSRVFDAETPVDWNSVQWQTSTPASTSVSLRVRTGDTPTPDATWTPFAALTTQGSLAGMHSRYIQYEATLVGGDGSVTPVLEDIILSTGHAPVAVDDTFNVGENTSRTFLSSGPGSLIFNDTDADANDVLRVRDVGAATNGQVVLNADGSVTYTPAANYNGPDSFVYTVTDGMLVSSATVSLTVSSVNNAPEANPDFYNIDEDTSLTVSAANGLLSNDMDAENDILHVVLVSPPSFASSFSLNANGAFTYVPVASFAGPDQFTYKANDGQADSAVVTVQILMNQVNDPPIAEPDAFTAVLNQTLQVAAPGVLGNDHDVEVESAAPLSAQLETTTTNGTLVFNADGSFAYTPNADYLGLDSFTYRASDSFNAVGNVTTVTLTVALKAVSANVASGSTVTTGTTVSASDPLQSAVTTPTDALIAIAQGVISDSQSPSGYTFLNQQVNIAVINPDGTEVFASPQSPLTFTFTIDQSLLPPGQDEQTFEIFRNGVRVPNCLGATTIPASNLDPCVSQRVNNAPASASIQLTILTTHASRWNMGVATSALGELTARNDGPFTTNKDVPLVVGAPGVLGNDFGTGTIDAQVSGTPEGGTVTLLPSGAFTFTPAAGFCGPASFAYTAGIGAERSAPATVSIAINCDPVAQNDSTTVLEDSGETMIAVLTNDNDPDAGQTLRLDSITQGAHGVVAIGPDGTWLTYAPAANFFGSDSFTYSVRDDLGGLATGTVQVTVTPVNDAPSFVAGTNVSLGEDAAAQSLANWATALSAGPDETDALSFVVTNDNASLFAVAPQLSSTGTLTFTPAANMFGVANVTVVLNDNGGTLDGGVDTSAPQSFTITMGPINDPPSFLKGADQTLLEDTGAQTVATWATQISAGPGEGTQTVQFLVAADDATLFSVQPVVSADGTLTYDPAPNANGTATVSVRAQDDGGVANGGVDTSAAQTFTITLNLVNDAPTFTKGADQTVLEDAGPQSVPAWATNMSAGPADENGQALEFLVSADQPELFVTQPALDASGALTYTPAANAYGAATISVRLRDDGGTLNGGSDTSVVQTFTITITPVNDAPSFVKGADQSVGEDSGAHTIAAWATNLSAGPADEAGQSLAFIVTTDNATLFSQQPAISVDGTLTYAVAADVVGTATVTVRLRDDGGTLDGGSDTSAPQTFAIVITAVNDAPAFVKGADQTVLEDSGAHTLAAWATGLSAGPADEAGQLLTFVVSNDNNGLFAQQPAVAADGTLTFAVAPNVAGSATISVRLSDNGGTLNGGSDTSAPQTFTITVTPVNDVPLFTAGAAQTVPEDAGPQSVTAWASGISAGPANESGQSLTFVVSNDSNTLFSVQPAVSPDGTLTYTPAANALGTATVSVQLRDNGGTLNGGSDTTAVQTFVITVVAVNDAPSFTKGADQMVIEDAGAQSAAWATNISAGPGDEAGQTLTFVVSNDNNALFTQQPAIAANGTLTFTPAANAFGSAVVTVQLVDNGGTLNGGVDRRAPVTFTINVTAVNDDPTAVADTGTVMQDSSATINVLSNDSSAPDPTETLTVSAVTPAANGSVQIVNAGAAVSYAPNAGFSGTDTFTYTVSDGNGGTATATVTMTVRPMPTMRVEDTEVFEGNSGHTPAVFEINLSHDSALPVTVNYETLSGSARDGRDYVSTSGTVTFAPGVTRQTVSVNVVGETQKEKDETFALRISSPTNATIVRAEGIGFIRDDDATPTANMTQTNTREGDSLSTSSLTYQVTLSNTSEIPVSVDYSTLGVTATSDVDFESTTGTLTFGEDETVKYITIRVKGDRQHEALERVRLRLANGIAMILQTTEADGVIEDDDLPPSASVSDISIVEGHDGVTSAVFTVTLSEPSGKPEAVSYITADGTAVAGTDYTAVAGTLTFVEGVTSMTVTVPVMGDGEIEMPETFALNLSPSSDVTIARGVAVATIVNDDSSTWLSGSYADLLAATTDQGAYVVDAEDGTLLLQPRLATEFSDATLPTGWTQSPNGTVSFANGLAMLDGAQIQNVGGLYSNHTLEFAATFTSASQHMGLTSLKFVTKADGGLYAVTLAPRNNTMETLIAGNWLGAEHRFRIDWTPTSITYSVDGNVVAVHYATYPSNANMMAIGADLGTGVLTLNWVRVTPYQTAGELVSAVYDAGSIVTWNSAAWTGRTPAGTAIELLVRSGDTPAPDASWTPYVPVASSGGAVNTQGRYAQYRVVLRTQTSGVSPELTQVAITFTK